LEEGVEMEWAEFLKGIEIGSYMVMAPFIVVLIIISFLLKKER
jgi:hypothetical protein